MAMIKETISLNTKETVQAPNFKIASQKGTEWRSDLKSWSIKGRGGYFKFNLNLELKQGFSLVLKLCSGLSSGKTNCPITVTVNGHQIARNFDPHRCNFYDQEWVVNTSYAKAGINNVTVQLGNKATTVVFIRDATVADYLPQQTIMMSSQKIVNAVEFSVKSQSGTEWRSDLKSWSIKGRGGYFNFKLTLPTAHGVNLILKLCSGASSGKTNCPITITANGNTVAKNFDPHLQNFYDHAWYIPSTVMKVGDNAIKMMLDSSASTVIFIRRAVITYFDMEHQQQSNWCWAAVAASISNYYNINSIWRQCTIVNAELGQTICCSHSSSSACNKPWYLDRALQRTGNYSSISVGSEPINEIQGEANNKRVLGIRIGWSGGGGHFIVTTGVCGQMVGVEDPWYGSSYIVYNTLVNKYQGSGRWTHSYFTKP